MNARTLLPWFAIAGLALALILLFNYWAPFQFVSMVVYMGLVLALAGALCALFPFRFLGVRKRRAGGIALVAGLFLTAASLFWPAPLVQVESHATQLDILMPACHFYERHTVRVHAPIAQSMAAIQQTTAGELPLAVGLMHVREAVLRQKHRGADAMGRYIILDKMISPGTGFVVLHRNDHEIVLGMAGRPWDRKRRPGLTQASQYANFQEPGSVKITFNLRVDDAGGGWSLITTETRVLGIDDSGRRAMARYWRLIVPGSGLIRRQWLNAIRDRAERHYLTPGAQAAEAPSVPAQGSFKFRFEEFLIA